MAELVPALARLDVSIDLVTPLRGGDAGIDSIPNTRIHRVPCPAPGWGGFYEEVQVANAALEAYCDDLIVNDGPFDLIHNHDWLTAFAAIALKHKHRLPLVTTIHATERGRGRGYLHGEQSERINDAEWRLTYESWRVICCAQFMAAELDAYFQTPENKIDIIPNGVDPSPFLALEGEDLSELRSRYARPEEKIVLYVGRLVYEKGIEILVRSAPMVLAQVPEAKFVIAGKGPELERMRELVQAMGLTDKVYLPGFISDEDRNRLYKVADCAVFPSLYEPFGIVALEAMAAGAPVVASEVGGLKEVVRHAETGITVYPGDPASCAWGIIHTLAEPGWARQRVQNACARWWNATIGRSLPGRRPTSTPGGGGTACAPTV